MNVTFSDDTASGRWANSLRGLRRVTLVARAEDKNGFEWLQALKLRLRSGQAEIKATHVLPLFDADPRVRRQVLKNVEPYSIFIVDLHEHRRQLLDPLIKRLGKLIPSGQDPYEFVLQLQVDGSDARMFLRQVLLNRSVLGQLDSLLEWATDPFRLHVDEDLAKLVGRPVAPGLTLRPSLQELGERELALVLARLGAAVGDVLSPQRQSEALISAFDLSQSLASPFLAVRELTRGLATDRMFDVGQASVWAEVQAAHLRIREYVEKQVTHRLTRVVHWGRLQQTPSHLELGIQAADIAAALAAREYERAGDSPRHSRPAAVKRHFAGVSLNGTWL